MKIWTWLKLLFLILLFLWLAGLLWNERQMVQRGHEVGRVCEPPGKAVIANGVEKGCVGDAYVSYEQTLWIPDE